MLDLSELTSCADHAPYIYIWHLHEKSSELNIKRKGDKRVSLSEPSDRRWKSSMKIKFHWASTELEVQNAFLISTFEGIFISSLFSSIVIDSQLLTGQPHWLWSCFSHLIRDFGCHGKIKYLLTGQLHRLWSCFSHWILNFDCHDKIKYLLMGQLNWLWRRFSHSISDSDCHDTQNDMLMGQPKNV